MRFLFFIILLALPEIAFSQGLIGTTQPQTAEVTGIETTQDPTVFLFISSFSTQLKPLLEKIITGKIFYTVVMNLFLFFAFMKMVFTVKDYMFASANTGDTRKAWLSLFTIGFVYFLIQAYLPALSALRGFALGLGEEVQFGLLGKRDPYYPLYYMYEVFDRTEFYWGSPDSLWEIPFWFINNAVAAVLGVILWALGFVMFLVNVVAGLWSIWTFTILASVGMIFLPFILSPQLDFLFNGWLRITIMVLLFGTFTRISSSLSVFGFSIFLGIPTLDAFDKKYWVLTANGGLADVLSIIAWTGMSIYGIRASFAVAQAVVSGMGASLAAPKGIG
jgi:hypothetical protein